MTTTDLLADMASRDIRVWRDGDQLAIDAPDNRLTDDDLDEIARYKAEILMILKATLPTDAYAIRAVVATWSEADREAWGRLANQIMDTGVPWPDHEIQAFEQLGCTLAEAVEWSTANADHFVDSNKMIPTWIDEPRLTVSMTAVRRSLS